MFFLPDPIRIVWNSRPRSLRDVLDILMLAYCAYVCDREATCEG
jgi:hypothetical protein